jgi:hypothetical protein
MQAKFSSLANLSAFRVGQSHINFLVNQINSLYPLPENRRNSPGLIALNLQDYMRLP